VTALAVAPIELDCSQRQRALDEVIVHAWDVLIAGREVACPVCGGDMDPEYGAQARPISGRCRNCGTRLT
jgi:hypothetical protein